MKIFLTLLFLTSLYCFSVPKEGSIYQICKGSGAFNYTLSGSEITIDSSRGLVVLQFMPNYINVLDSDMNGIIHVYGNENYKGDKSYDIYFDRTNIERSKCQP